MDSADESTLLYGEEVTNIWLPFAIEESDKLFFLDAEHRGEMYHYRAAMSVKKHHLCIVNCKKGDQISLST